MLNKYTQNHFNTDLYDLKTLKDFVRMIVYKIDDNYSNFKTGEKSVL